MRLIVGVDIRRRSQGAVRFGTWLRMQLGPEAVELLPVHVLPHDELMLQLRRRHLSEVLEQTRAAVTTVLDEAGCGELGESLEVVQAMTPEQHLARMVDQAGADGLVIGRSALREDRALVRLGQVARRLARSLPSPVTIVPPDLEQSDLGDGPILCAVSPDPGSLAAARAAFDLARSLGRGLCLLYVAPLAEVLGTSMIGPAYDDDIAMEMDLGRKTMERWCQGHGLPAEDLTVVAGDPATKVLEQARALRSPLIVCGSRRLDLVQRLFSASLGTALARHSPVPVMIVPVPT